MKKLTLNLRSIFAFTHDIFAVVFTWFAAYAFRFNFEKDLQKMFGKKTFFLFRKSEKFSCYENLKILEKVRKKMLYTRANTKCD